MLDSFFNATMTFRRDSDIFVPYGRVVAKPGVNHTLEKRPVDVSLFDHDILAAVKKKTRYR